MTAYDLHEERLKAKEQSGKTQAKITTEEMIRRAVAAERESCAKIASAIYGNDSCGECSSQERIAKAIRARGKE